MTRQRRGHGGKPRQCPRVPHAPSLNQASRLPAAQPPDPCRPEWGDPGVTEIGRNAATGRPSGDSATDTRVRTLDQLLKIMNYLYGLMIAKITTCNAMAAPPCKCPYGGQVHPRRRRRHPARIRIPPGPRTLHKAAILSLGFHQIGQPNPSWQGALIPGDLENEPHHTVMAGRALSVSRP
jgi:hypothetical protein